MPDQTTTQADATGKTVQGLLLGYATSNPMLQTIIEDILSYNPHAFNSQDVSSQAECNLQQFIQQPGRWWKKTRDLIKKRNGYFDALKTFPPNPLAADFANIHQLAIDATSVGYVNAFFHLAGFYHKNGYIDKAIQAYLLVPQTSRDYFQAILAIQQVYFAKAMTDKDSQKAYLKQSLEYALKLQDDATREACIQRIAFCYLTQGKETGLADLNPVNSEWLQAMNEFTSIEWCFARFDEIQAQRTMQKTLNAQAVEIAALKKQIEQQQLENANLQQLVPKEETLESVLAKAQTMVRALQLSPPLGGAVTNNHVATGAKPN